MRTAPGRPVPLDAPRALAALLGAPVVAFLVGAAVVRFLPGSEEAAFAIGLHLVIPLCVLLACVLPLAENGKRAWAWCLAIALPLGIALAVGGTG